MGRFSAPTAAGVPIETGMGVSATVTVEFVGLNLEEAVNRILAAAGENNFATEYTKKPGLKKDEYKIDKIVVVRKGASSPVAPLIVEKVTEAQIKAAMQKREQEYRRCGMKDMSHSCLITQRWAGMYQ